MTNTKTEPIHIISLGAGVQSSTMALMVEHDEIMPRPIAAGFGDTKDEPEEVYTWLEWLKQQLSYPVEVHCKGDLMRDNLQIFTSSKTGKKYMKGLIPAFIQNRDGSVGIMGRRCTGDYKVEPMVKQARRAVGREAMLAWRKNHRAAIKQLTSAKKSKTACPYSAWKEMQDDALVVMWIGISADEISRMKPSRHPWIRNRWPLVEKNMARQDCKDWMKKNGYPEPPRSACKKCPFHDDNEWINQRDNRPDEFTESVAYEREMQLAALQSESMEGVPYLHPSCVPLDQVKLIWSQPKPQQLTMMIMHECEGMCGV